MEKDLEYVLSEKFLRDFTVRFSLFRLALILIIFVLLEAVWLGIIPQINYFIENQYLYIIFFVCGFGLNLIYLLTWNKFKSAYYFVYLQFISDIFLAFYIIFLTGGLKSSLFFLILVTIFLYGKILGLRTSIYFSALCVLIYLIVGIIQFKYPFIWQENSFSLSNFFFYFILNFLSLFLINLLVYFSESREKSLFNELISQEIALSRAEALKKSIFDLMESMVFVLEPEKNTIISLNQKALSFLGLKHLSLALGRSISYYNKELSNIIETNKKDKKSFNFKLGERSFLGKISYLEVENSYLVILHETTELEKLQEKIFQMEKLASLGELAAGVAHEIKNPLAGIKASLQLLQEEEDKELQTKLFTIVLREVDRLDRLVKNFLSFAKPREGDKEWVNIASLVKELIILAPLEPGKIKLQLDLDSSLEVFWNREHLKQVLLNLLLNAKEAALEGKKEIFIGLEKKEETWSLVIADKGKGIKKEEIKKVFDPFFSTKKQGTGLGLSIALRLCHLNESSLEIESEEGKGTKVSLILGKVKHG